MKPFIFFLFFVPWRCRFVLYLAGPAVGLLSAGLHEGWCRRFLFICPLSVLTEAWARHDLEIFHAFCFFRQFGDGADGSFGWRSWIGPTSSTSRARRTVGNGRWVLGFNNNMERRNAVKSAHHGGAFVLFIHLFYFFCVGSCRRWLLTLLSAEEYTFFPQWQCIW